MSNIYIYETRNKRHKQTV